ncbi:fibronectin type III domain-containing protein [Actinoplanes friuliensis]|nr:fibronectin type III domain-containing protein [Actinoplanes friuliensis]
MKKTSLAAMMIAVLIAAFAYVTVSADAAVARAPGPPTRVAATAQDRSALVRWKPPESTGGSPVSGYVVTAQPGGATITTTAVTSVQVGGLVNGRRYTFTVAAVNVAGTGARSRPSAPVVPQAATRPGRARSVSAVAGNQSATVTWKPPAGDGGSPITGYRVRAVPGDTETTVTGDVRSTTVSGLTNGTRYRFTVVAVNAVGAGPSSDRSRVVTPAVGPPAAPSSVGAAAAGRGGVTVTWEPGDDGGSPITGYEIVASPGGATARAGKDDRSATIKGLRSGTAYTFGVRARNVKGRGAPATTAPTRPDVTVLAGTVVLSKDSLAALTDVSDGQTLTFTDAPTQVTGLKPGNVLVADVSEETPLGLLRKVVSVTTDGATTSVVTAEASLDEALSNGAVAVDTELGAEDIEQFAPARDGVRLVAPKGVAKLDQPSLTISLDVDLVKEGNRKVTLSGSQKITPSVSFDASVRCCTHTESHFTASVAVERKLEAKAEISKEIKRSIPLGRIDFTPIRFSIGFVPVVIVPRMELTLETSGKISAGIVTSVSETTTSGVDIRTRDSRVTAREINTRSTAYQQPTVFAAAEFTAGPRIRMSLMLYGVVGPYVQITVRVIDLKADTSADSFVTLKLSGSIGAGFQLSLLGKKIADWERDPLVSFEVPLYQSGPFMGVTVTPAEAVVPAGGTVPFTATVARSPVQTVVWSVKDGEGTITQDGVYTAPDKAGRYEITATSPANGLKPETRATGEVEVTAEEPEPGRADVLIAGSGDYGSTTGASWLKERLEAAGYTVEIDADDDLPDNLSGYDQIWAVSTSPFPDDDLDRLVAFVKSGRGLFLTGERPCCESINAADTTIVKQLVTGLDSLQIGGLGDPFPQLGPVPLKADAPGGVTRKPFAVDTWTVDAPGGLAGVPARNVIAEVDNGEAPAVPIAAAWGPDEVSGGGRLTLLMDINWNQPAEMDPVTANQLAQNLAFFLSGDAAPPGPPAAVAAGSQKKSLDRTRTATSSAGVR